MNTVKQILLRVYAARKTFSWLSIFSIPCLLSSKVANTPKVTNSDLDIINSPKAEALLVLLHYYSVIIIVIV